MARLQKSLVGESEKTKKTREKLRRHLEEIDRNITPQALKRKSLEIHRWIARHAANRIPLKGKTISLFDENQHAASISLKVSKLAKKIGNMHFN